MPLYEYGCRACGLVTERLQPVTVGCLPCPACEGPAERLISAPAALPPFTAYYDHGAGERFESRDQRKAWMRATNSVEKGTTEMSGAKGTIFSHPGRATESVPKSGAQLGPVRG